MRRSLKRRCHNPKFINLHVLFGLVINIHFFFLNTKTAPITAVSTHTELLNGILSDSGTEHVCPSSCTPAVRSSPVSFLLPLPLHFQFSNHGSRAPRCFSGNSTDTLKSRSSKSMSFSMRSNFFIFPRIRAGLSVQTYSPSSVLTFMVSVGMTVQSHLHCDCEDGIVVVKLDIADSPDNYAVRWFDLVRISAASSINRLLQGMEPKKQDQLQIVSEADTVVSSNSPVLCFGIISIFSFHLSTFLLLILIYGLFKLRIH